MIQIMRREVRMNKNCYRVYEILRKFVFKYLQRHISSLWQMNVALSEQDDEENAFEKLMAAIYWQFLLWLITTYESIIKQLNILLRTMWTNKTGNMKHYFSLRLSSNTFITYMKIFNCYQPCSSAFLQITRAFFLRLFMNVCVVRTVANVTLLKDFWPPEIILMTMYVLFISFRQKHHKGVYVLWR